MSYMLLTFFALLLVTLQTMMSNLFFFGELIVEISLIMAVYAGFNMTLMKGGAFSFILGFFLDCFIGSVSGLFALSYVIIFLIAKFVSLRIYAERVLFIAFFVGLCALLEGILVVAFYKFVLGVDKFHYMWDVFLPQALIVGFLGPSFFALFGKFDAMGKSRRNVRI